MKLKVRDQLKPKVLKLTSAFEGFTGKPAGNFDGQLLSWGPLQWNVGQGTLQPLLRRIRELNPEQFERIMGDEFSSALDNGATFRWYVASQVLSGGRYVTPEYKQAFVALSKTPEALQAFSEAAGPYYDRAARLCEALGFKTERGYALCFDVAVQNGAPRQDHISEFKRRRLRGAEEWRNLKVFAKIVAEKANKRWYHDVLSRKMAIALGGGTVHGVTYDLEDDFGISYHRIWYTGGVPCGIKRVFVDGKELAVAKASLVGNKLYLTTKK